MPVTTHGVSLNYSKTKEPMHMNTGIVMIGFSLVLLSVAFMVAPATANATSPADCSGCLGIAGNTFHDAAGTDIIIPIESVHLNSSKHQCHDHR